MLISVWHHDIGQATGGEEPDHAVTSEAEARRLLAAAGLSPDGIEEVAHCVRAHRCRDVQSKSLEAKIVAAADSASHMTDINYIVMASGVSARRALEKLERDYRDVGLVPDLRDEITPLYEAWRRLLDAYAALADSFGAEDADPPESS